ncbi:DUF2975 domain-containing protein [Arthrobacter sp. MYb213]|uniref:DUF2975 domain-containing protein n=1 Tax=Arthrobacter sp. MYb213 TaxID=1848595 RepID=UPI000CFD4D5C|nr:DUF2975 domain-containing protein [Arthrobacter sp. MYb213]PRB67152.1 ABC transporter [Arthrobacter sp. MYb213]
MSAFSTLALRIVLSLIFAGSLFIQCFMIPLIAMDMADLPAEFAYLRISLLSYAVVALLIVEISCLCVAKLITRVRRGTVFTAASFKFVNVIIAAISLGSLMTFVLGTIMAPGDAVAPGVVLLVGGFGVLLAGIALIVWVLRQLLFQASTTEAQAAALRTELGGVI